MYTDFYNDDKHKTFYKICQIKKLPNFFKKATFCNEHDIPEEKFAVTEKRAFPCHDPASTYLSYCYSQHNSTPVPTESMDFILKKAHYWGIGQDIVDYQKKHMDWEDKFTKTAAEKDCAHFDGKRRHFPITDPMHVYSAVPMFEKFSHRYDIPTRNKIARFIVKKAQNFGIPVRSEVVLTYTSNSVDPLLAANNIAARSMTPGISMQEKKAYIMLGKGLLEARVSDAESMEKIAHVVEKLDRINGIDKEYGFTVPSAHQSVFNTPIEMLKKATEMIDLAGEYFSLTKLSTLPPELYSDALGKDFTVAVVDDKGKVNPQKLKMILPTLPLPDKETLRKYVIQHVGDEV